jgi:uncharacterized membrane protein YbaN (DUF454 family)
MNDARATEIAAPQALPASRLKRVTLASIGVLCVGLGAAGAVTPGLPTTVFLIIASGCFTKSCPWLEERLLRNRLFRPYLRYLDGEPMPTRARVFSIGAIWLFSGLSLAILHTRDVLPTLVAAAIISAALIGSLFVWRWGRSAAQG